MARILGIDLNIHFSWILIFGLVLFTLSDRVFPEAYPFWSDQKTLLVAAVAAFLFFASVVAHELAHAVVARIFRMKVSSITLFLLGGVANLTEEPKSARSEFAMAIAGPATSFALGGLGLLIEVVTTAPGLQPVQAVAGYLGAVNITLGIFNMVPGFPLDGGRVLRSLIWGLKKDRSVATRIAARGGQAVAVLLVLGGGYLVFRERDTFGGTWYFLIAYFLYTSASSSLSADRAAGSVRGALVAGLMSTALHAATPAMVIGTVVRDLVLPFDLRAVPVVVQGSLVGLVFTADLRNVAQEQWPVTPVSQVMHGVEGLPSLSPRDPLTRAMELFGETEAPLLPVLEGTALVGLLTRDSLAGYIRMRETLGLADR